MVMKKSAMQKNLTQSIVKSLGRYIAIVAIIALGAGLFMGLLMTKQDMVATGQRFMDRQNMFDLRLISDYGWSEDSLEAVKKLDGVQDAEGIAYLDVLEAASRRFDLPIAVYNVSGEYAMVKAAAEKGWIDEKRIVMENLIAMKRAGAAILITYHALDAAKWLKEE